MSGLLNRTVRWRLTLLLATLILGTSVVLLVLSYVLVNANLSYGTSSQRPVAPRSAGTPGTGPVLAAAPATAGARTTNGGTSGSHGEKGKAFTLSATPDEVAHHERSALLVQYAVILGALVLVAGVVAWVIAGRLLRPLRTITTTARRITGERLHERLALPGPSDEIKDLGDTFDAMLARLEVAFKDRQLFAANAAHELRTPLGVMHAELDLALADAESSEQRETLLRLKRTVLACERLTERLLSLTRGELAATERQPVALDRVVAERLVLARPTAGELTVRDDLQTVVTLGDPALLGQLVENLIENAIKYNVAQGWIDIRLRRDGEHAVLKVSNSGPKLQKDELAGLLEPFRRAAQQRVGAGNGLGLSIVRTIVAAHDGKLSLDAIPDGGLCVTVTLAAVVEQCQDSAAADQPVTHTAR